MFNLIAKAKEAGYQFWISASKVLTVTNGTEMGLTDWALPAFVDFSGEPDHETILSWLSEVGIRNAGMHLEDIEFLSVEENPDAYISL